MQKKQLSLIGVPSCLGGNVAGCENGPGKLMPKIEQYLEVEGRNFKTLGNVPIPGVCTVEDPTRKCITEINQLTENLADFVKQKIDLHHAFPVVVGGDHSITYCYIHWLKSQLKNEDLGIIWFDAHGDFNTPETTETGNMHGMPLAMLTGHSWNQPGEVVQPLVKEEHASVVGVRSLDQLEAEAFADSSIQVITMERIRTQGVEETVAQITRQSIDKPRHYHISLDLDCIDPVHTPGVGTPVQDGFTKAEIQEILERLPKQKLISFGLMEYNPEFDKNDTTIQTALSLIDAIL